MRTVSAAATAQLKLPRHLDGFLIDANVYPGSSGSVVIVKPQLISFDHPNEGMIGGPHSLPYVLGLVSGSIPLFDSALGTATRMGLGMVQSADSVSATIEALFTKK